MRKLASGFKSCKLTNDATKKKGMNLTCVSGWFVHRVWEIYKNYQQCQWVLWADCRLPAPFTPVNLELHPKHSHIKKIIFWEAAEDTSFSDARSNIIDPADVTQLQTQERRFVSWKIVSHKSKQEYGPRPIIFLCKSTFTTTCHFQNTYI